MPLRLLEWFGLKYYNEIYVYIVCFLCSDIDTLGSALLWEKYNVL